MSAKTQGSEGHGGLSRGEEMNYRLSFLDDGASPQDVWQANFETEHTAVCWMWIVGGVWILKSDWSIIELWCRRCREMPVKACPRSSYMMRECCIARIPAKELRPSSKAERPQPRARPIVLVVERDNAAAASHENAILDAGLSVGASWPDSLSAEKWLNAHNPDAAILDVKLKDKACVELAEKLTVREIPFIVVSGHSADTLGLEHVFRSAPWLGKPVSSAGLQLALRSIL